MKTKMFKKMLSMILIGGIISSSAATGSTVYGSPSESIEMSVSDELPIKIQQEKKDFDKIQPLFDRYKAEDERHVDTFDLVNGDSKVRRINFVSFYEEEERPVIQPMESKEFDIPEDFISSLRLFGDLRFEATFASNMDYEILEPDGKGGYDAYNSMVLAGGWLDKDSGVRVNYIKTEWLLGDVDNAEARFLRPEEHLDADGNIDWSGYKIRITNKSDEAGSLRSIFLWEENGIDKTYDTTAYTVIGGDKEILDVTIEFDASKILDLDGEDKLDESKFKTFHTNSGPIAMTDGVDTMNEMDQTYSWAGRDYNFVPGRGVYHFDTEYSGVQNAEDISKDGYANYSGIKSSYIENQIAQTKYDRLFPTLGNEHVITFDFWPSYMWYNENLDREGNGNGSPAVEHFDAAAELAGVQVAAFNEKFGEDRAPKYIEVKNESTISAEWPYFTDKSYGEAEAWELLADFHNKVADAIHEEAPNQLVGGPSTAFLYLEKEDFKDAKYHMEFMDDTADTLDFYSHHFYENSTLVVNDPDAEVNPDGYLNGRFEGVMDLLVNHMEITDNVEPIVITEAGSYNATEGDIGAWHKLKATNGYMLRFMDMPQTIDVFTPYLYPIINWKREANNAFYKYASTSGTTVSEEMTLLEAYIDLWEDYRGSYIPVDADNELIYTNATRQGDTVYVAVSNMNPQRVNIDLNAIAGGTIGEVTRKHVYLEKGELVYEEETVENPNESLMRVEELSVYEIKLVDAQDVEGTVVRDTDYGDKTLQPTGSDSIFKIESELEQGELSKTVLRVHFGKDTTGFKEDLYVTVNGRELPVIDLGFTDKQGDVFTYKDIELDTKDVKAINEIKVNIPEEDGFISSVQLFNYYDTDKTPIVANNISELESLVTEAEATLEEVVTSATGSDVEKGEKWATADEKIGMNTALNAAYTVLGDTQARTSQEITKALEDLQKVMDIFPDYVKEVMDATKLPTISFEALEAKDNISLVKDNAKIEYISGVAANGVVHGDKALKYTLVDGRTDSSDWTSANSSHLILDAPDGDWDLTNEKGNAYLNYTVTNPGNSLAQVRMLLTDVAGTTAMYYNSVNAGATITVELTDDSFKQQPVGNWTGAPYGLSEKALDPTHITSIKFCFYEASVVDGSSFIIDNINANGPIEEKPATLGISFEEDEDINISIVRTENDAATYEIIETDGVTDGNKALKYTINSGMILENNDPDYGADNWNSAMSNHVVLTRSDNGVWNLDNGSGSPTLNIDIKNVNNHASQVRVLVKDTAGTTGLYFATLAAGANTTLKLSADKFTKQPMNWTTGPIGLANIGLDTENIKEIKFCFEEAKAIAGDSFIIDNINNSTESTEGGTTPPVDPNFVKVTNLTVNPTTIQWFAKETRYEVVPNVMPATATNKGVVWTMVDAGSTGATITEDGTLQATDKGQITLLATVKDGLATGEDFSKEISMTISNYMVSVTDVTGIPNQLAVGEKLSVVSSTNKDIVVEPENASLKNVQFTIEDAGTTGATIVGGALTTTAEGVVTIKATIQNGKFNTEDKSPLRVSFEKEFKITIGDATVAPDPTHEMTHHPRVEATCTSEGTVEYWSCSKCDKNFSDEEGTKEITDIVIEALGHEMTHHAAVEATCISEGAVEYWSCSKCNRNFSDEEGTKEITDIVIEALGHEMTHHPRVEATCTSEGTIEYWSCSSCDKKFSDAQGIIEVEDIIIGKTNHKLLHHEAVEATCEVGGVKEHWSCPVCDQKFSDENGTIVIEDVYSEALGHNLVHCERVEPTVDKAGTVEHWLCTVCNEKFADKEGTIEIQNVVIEKLEPETEEPETEEPETEEPETDGNSGPQTGDSAPIVGLVICMIIAFVMMLRIIKRKKCEK